MRSDEQEALIRAVNLLCEYVQKNMPSGWELTMEMTSEDPCLRLFDPSGEEHEIPTAEWDESTIAAACDVARELMQRWQGNAYDEDFYE